MTHPHHFNAASTTFDDGWVPEAPDLALDHMLEFVKSAGESTSRARHVLLLLITAAVATFAAYWNLDHSLAQRRVALVERALHAGPTRRGADPCKSTDDRADCLQRAPVWNAVRASLDTPDKQAPDSVAVRALRAQLDTLRGASGGDARHLKLPVLDVTFDAPDLWLFSGLGFDLLLIALVYCIACERRDVGQAFRVARELHMLRMCHRLLAMQQVLTVPERPAMPGRRVWRTVARALFFIPVAVHGYGMAVVLGQSHRTVGGVPELSGGAWYLHGFLLTLAIVLTLVADRLERGYEGKWTTWTLQTFKELD